MGNYLRIYTLFTIKILSYNNTVYRGILLLSIIMLKNIIPNAPHKKARKKTKSILTNEFIEDRSYNLVALVGYVILGFIFFDYLNLLIPPQLFNPSWELETIGKFIETIWILLLGFMLVFFRTQQRPIKATELKLLSFLSWLTLAIAIICFLTAPLLISNALRINQNAKTQINTQLTNQNKRVEIVLTEIEEASDTEINTLLSNSQLALSNSVRESKQQLINTVKQQQQIETQQLKQSLKNKQSTLFKTTFKWAIGAIIAGITLVSIWKYTSWTRTIKI